jgi:hypothetical protein
MALNQPSHDINIITRPKPYTNSILNYLSSALNDWFVQPAHSGDVGVYEHATLAGSHQVRLMVLHPAVFFESPLECDLLCTELGNIPYEALSYVWGAGDFCHTLLCHGKALRVSRNLFRALHFLRRKFQKRILWVDAVCIDQSDPAEKETQIPLMGDIYSKATRSLIWLGEAEVGVLSGFWMLRMFHPLLLITNAYANLIPFREQVYHEAKIDLRPQRRDIYFHIIIRKLLEREWFTRTWTLQELLLNNSSVLMCGRHSLPVRILEAHTRLLMPWVMPVVYYPAGTLREHWRFQGLVLLQYSGSSAYSKNEVDALQFMMVVETASTSNSKDKVIGIQAILQKIGVNIPKLSYAMSREYLYTTLAECWMRHWGTLGLLALTKPRVDSRTPPTWVVDWNSHSERANEFVSNAYTRLVYLGCRDSTTGMRISATRKRSLEKDAFSAVYTAGQLLLRGFLVSTIAAHVGPSGVTYCYARPENTEDCDIDQRRRNWSQTARTVILWANFLVTASSTSDSYKNTISCFAGVLNVGPKVLITSRYQLEGLESDLESMAALTKVLDRDDATFASELKGDRVLDSALWLAISLRADSETLFTTTDGRIGICHVQSVRPGDNIALIAGSDFPLVLRKHSASCHDQFLLLGPAILSTQPSAVLDLDERWKRLEQSRSYTESLFKPMLRGQNPGEERLSNHLHKEDSRYLTKVSALMRGEEWPLHVDVGIMARFVLV